MQAEYVERIVFQLLFPFDSFYGNVDGTSQENAYQGEKCQFWRQSQPGKGSEHGVSEEYRHQDEQSEKYENGKTSW
jgi:hypothetical protein